MMMRLIYGVFLSVILATPLWSQDTTGAEADDLFLLMETSPEESLLPERMLLSQRLLWGEKGLFRKVGWAPLTPDMREKELELRRKMLTAHQVVGYATLAGMLAQGIIGGRLYNGEYRLYNTHKTMGNVVTALYFTDAGLS